MVVPKHRKVVAPLKAFILNSVLKGRRKNGWSKLVSLFGGGVGALVAV